MSDNKPKIIGLIAIVLIATAGTGAVLALSKKTDKSASDASTTSTATPATTTETTTPSATESTTTATYNDGTYTATGSYSSPGGEEEIGVTVTLANNIVTAASVDTSSAQGDAAEYQEEFASGYKSSVIGKAINSISLSRVSGSSLTSNGFNNAINTIKNQAKA